MKEQTLTNKINLYSLYLLCFSISFHKKAIAPLIIIFLITSLVNGDYRFKEKSKNILFFTTIFIVYAIGMLYSENISYGLKDLETKLSLLVFPIAFFISKINFRSMLETTLKWFIIGLILSSITCLVEAIYQFNVTGDENEFFYYKLSLFHHTSYISMYLNLGIIICYHFLFQQSKSLVFKKVYAVSIITFFTIMIVMLSAKTGIITMLITHGFAITYWAIKTKSYLKSLLIINLIVFSFFAAYQSSSIFNARIKEAVSTLLSSNRSKTSTTAVRIDTWKTSLEIISVKSFLGYGTGDVKDVIMNKYKEKELHHLIETKLNPHNQFLQTTIAIGLLGCVIFILLLFIPTYHSVKRKEMLLPFFILLFSISMLTESMLETQSGVIFYAFFNSLLFISYFPNKAQLPNK